MRTMMGKEKQPSLEEAIEEVKRTHQQYSPEFIDLFVDVLFQMVVEIIESKDKKSQSE